MEYLKQHASYLIASILLHFYFATSLHNCRMGYPNPREFYHQL